MATFYTSTTSNSFRMAAEAVVFINEAVHPSNDLECHEDDDDLTLLYDGVAGDGLSHHVEDVDFSVLMDDDSGNDEDLLGCDEEIEYAFAAAEVSYLWLLPSVYGVCMNDDDYCLGKANSHLFLDSPLRSIMKERFTAINRLNSSVSHLVH